MIVFQVIGISVVSILAIGFLCFIWICIVDEIGASSAEKIDKKLAQENEDLKYEISTLKNKVFFSEKLFQRMTEYCKELESKIQIYKDNEDKRPDTAGDKEPNV